MSWREWLLVGLVVPPAALLILWLVFLLHGA